jgi:hypothetical protein
MTKFLSYVFLTILTVAISVSVMMFGWGLRPVSWGWIIGMGVFGNIAVHGLLMSIGKEDKN